MDLSELQVFLTVASERSFSRAAAKLHRTQPAVSQAIRRLEDELGERLFDRSSKQGALTEAGRVLREYAQRLMRLSEEAEQAVRELRDLRRGRVLIGANEAAVHALLPLIGRFRAAHAQIQVDVRRVPSRQVGVEVAQVVEARAYEDLVAGRVGHVRHRGAREQLVVLDRLGERRQRVT